MITTITPAQSFEQKAGYVKTNLVSLRSYVVEKRNYLIFKRLFDIVLSLLIIVFVLSWLIPVIAILIKLDSRGPVFFVQRRVGRFGRSFRCLKFRTMVVNEYANTRQATEHDMRITRLGNFLRVSNLDEFPQFLNVLLGHMSVVGPRPHMHADCKKFSSLISHYKFRNMMRPGITGLAQVKGYRGPTRNFESIFHRYQFDAFYIRNANFWLDMRIVRKTAAQTFQILWLKATGKSKRSALPPSAQPQWKGSVKNLN
ncbi:sugar transferase [Pseudoflavitalea sp. G-6-1-2]|uniref:sugar transferase n=1 Tax=Pseudoflavitalea sp. G-6-1-2 TaxID=2728841 RepID=UPI001F10787D|nr:sugar transferase [Pseudoflavitalea sp. G-6-1-2]